MYKSMFRPEVIRRVELCFSDLAKLPSLPWTSEIHHVVFSAERSTSVYINFVRCVYHCFAFSLVLGVSPIEIVVCLINILICSSGVLVNFHLSETEIEKQRKRKRDREWKLSLCTQNNDYREMLKLS